MMLKPRRNVKLQDVLIQNGLDSKHKRLETEEQFTVFVDESISNLRKEACCYLLVAFVVSGGVFAATFSFMSLN